MDYTELRNISNQLANLQIGRLNNDYWNRRYFMYFDETNNTKKLLIKLQNNGTYKFNNEFLTDSKHKSGNYYQYNEWNVTNYFKNGQNNELNVIPGQGSYGSSYKSVLSVLMMLLIYGRNVKISTCLWESVVVGF